MNAGRMNHRFDLQERTDTPDGQGGAVPSWSTVERPWGRIEPLSASERYFTGRTYADATHKVHLRYTGKLNARSKLKLGSRELHVLGVTNVDERSKQMVAIVKEKV